MSKQIPLISSGVAGPLGALHLPRLWSKLSLEAVGKLADDYPGAGPGFDQMVIDGLGLNRESTLQFIHENKPSYVEFEAWVVAHGTKITPQAIRALNEAIRGYNHADETRQAILSSAGLPDDATAPQDAIGLNNLEDWQDFWEAEIK